MPTWSMLKSFSMQSKNVASYFEKSNLMKATDKMLTDFWRLENA